LAIALLGEGIKEGCRKVRDNVVDSRAIGLDTVTSSQPGSARRGIERGAGLGAWLANVAVRAALAIPGCGWPRRPLGGQLQLGQLGLGLGDDFGRASRARFHRRSGSGRKVSQCQRKDMPWPLKSAQNMPGDRLDLYQSRTLVALLY
jgi:hypothetical protein